MSSNNSDKDVNKPTSRESKKSKDRLKSVRILIVEPKGYYCRKVWCAIGVGLTHLLLGATIMTMLMYSIKTGDAHVGVCTLAFAHIIISPLWAILVVPNVLNILASITFKLETQLAKVTSPQKYVYPGGQYWNIIFCHLLVGVSQLFIAAILTIILIYSLKTNFNDVHVIWCTFGYHFFSAEAILSLNYANGWSSPLRLRHRRFSHVFLQMCALVFAITGATLVTFAKGITDTAHGITGVITTVLAIITFLSGPCGLFGGRYWKILHMSVGIPTFLMSSVCLCLGVTTSGFRNWAGDSVVFIVISFVAFYTAFIVITSFMKCVMRI